MAYRTSDYQSSRLIHNEPNFNTEWPEPLSPLIQYPLCWWWYWLCTTINLLYLPILVFIVILISTIPVVFLLFKAGTPCSSDSTATYLLCLPEITGRAPCLSNSPSTHQQLAFPFQFMYRSPPSLRSTSPSRPKFITLSSITRDGWFSSLQFACNTVTLQCAWNTVIKMFCSHQIDWAGFIIRSQSNPQGINREREFRISVQKRQSMKQEKSNKKARDVGNRGLRPADTLLVRRKRRQRGKLLADKLPVLLAYFSYLATSIKLV
jgi:hypothetical protein